MTAHKPKKLSAMELLLKSEALKPALSQGSALSRNAVTNLKDGVPVEISPAVCRPWPLADRPAAETAHKAELMQSFQAGSLGQLQPVIVRPAKIPDAPEIEYEVVCGCVRWMAAKELGVPLRAIVRELDDRQAYAVMSVENRQRQKLSDWARARSYRRALAAGVFESAGQLAAAEGISKSTLSLYLGFAELPDAVADAFTPIVRISYRTGYALARACKTLGVEALIALVPKIEAGEISRADLERMATPEVQAAAGNGDPAALDFAGAGQPDASTGTEQFSMENSDPPTDPGFTANTAALGFAGAGQPGASTGAEQFSMENSDGSQAGPVSGGREPQLKKTFVSATGVRLFTYNQAARGWLVRIDPGISMQIDEALIADIGRLIEARLLQK